MESKGTDCLIVGGGIIGLSLAYELARRGVSVTLLDQGEWGGQASNAAAGMLAPLKEFKEPGPLLDAGMASLAMYPAWAEALIAESGIDPQLALDGVLTVAFSDAEAEQWQQKYRWQHAAGYDVSWMGAAELRELEPLLAPTATAAIYSPGEGHINNRMLLQALITACRARGVRLIKGAVVTRLIASDGRVSGVVTTNGPVSADQTVITAGAWAGLIAGWLGLSVPIRPVRGQVAAVSSEGLRLRRVIFGADGYIVAKRDGRIILGATEDESGYSREVTAGGLATVLNGVLPYMPVLAFATFLQAWSGLRPGTPDGLPLLGPLPGWEGVSLASGHFRNGILLSPYTAKIMADWITTGGREPLVPFDPGRFA